METEQTALVRNAAIIAVAGAVAGISGAAASRALLPRREPTVAEQVREALNQIPQEARRGRPAFNMLMENLDEARISAKSEAKGSRKRAASAFKKSRKRGRRAKGNAYGSATSMAEELRDRLSSRDSDIAGSSPAFVDTAAQAIREYLDTAPGAAAGAYDEGRSRAARFHGRATKRGEGLLQDLSSTTRDALDDSVKPYLKRASETAGDNATDIRKTLEREAARIEKRYEKASPKVKSGAADLVSRIESEVKALEKKYDKSKPKLKATAKDVRKRVKEEARDLEKRLDDAKPVIEDSAHKVADVTEDLLHTAEDRLRSAEQSLQEGADQGLKIASSAGSSAKQGGKNLTSLLFWLTVAGGLIYAFLLNEEHQKSARRVASVALSEGKEVYRDVRGKDADFQA